MQLDFSFKSPKLEPIKIQKLRFKKQGERTLTQGDKNKEKATKGNKCQRCRKKFAKNILVIHHKKEVARYKPKGLNLSTLEFYDKRKKKAHYDSPKNLMVLCPTCHTIVHNQESIKKKAKKKKTKNTSFGGLPKIRLPY